MKTYVKINDNLYEATISGRLHDEEWDNRASKAIKVEMSYQDAVNLFNNDKKWSIVQDVENFEEIFDVETEEFITKTIIIQEEYDNSEYSIAGDIIDHRNGYITIKMGKPTAEEILAMLEEVF